MDIWVVIKDYHEYEILGAWLTREDARESVFRDAQEEGINLRMDYDAEDGFLFEAMDGDPPYYRGEKTSLHDGQPQTLPLTVPQEGV